MSERLLCNTNRAIFQPYHGVKGFLFDVCFVCLMVFNATFNSISAISWRLVLLVKKTGLPGENHRPDASNWQTLTPCPDRDSKSKHQW